jgi:hypothetical protein
VQDIEHQYQDQIVFLNQKIFNYENGFKNGVPLEKEEWKKFYDREVESLRSQNVSLLKTSTDF